MTEKQTNNHSSRSDDLAELNGLIQYQPGRISTDYRNEEEQWRDSGGSEVSLYPVPHGPGNEHGPEYCPNHS